MEKQRKRDQEINLELACIKSSQTHQTDAIADTIEKQVNCENRNDKFKEETESLLANVHKTEQFKAMNRKLDRIGSLYHMLNQQIEDKISELKEVTQKTHALGDRIDQLRSK